jgi:two-component system response regulator AlgR
MTLRVLIVDDEPLARSRLRTLLGNCGSPAVEVAAEAGNASQAMELISDGDFDAVFLDVQMPGADGVSLARALRAGGRSPAVVFVTAHAQHAVAAFEVEAVDYLTKPVRIERLQAALEKIQRRRAAAADADPEILLIQDRGRTERVPLLEVLYFKAELKYVTVRTSTRSYILDASLSELEDRHQVHFLRIHRNALVARKAVRALEKHYDPEEGEGWAVRLNGIDELLAVSRRQLSAVRDAISA